MRFLIGILLGFSLGLSISEIYYKNEAITPEPVEQMAVSGLTLNHIDDVSNSTRCYFFNEIPTHLDCVYLDTNVGK